MTVSFTHALDAHLPLYLNTIQQLDQKAHTVHVLAASFWKIRKDLCGIHCFKKNWIPDNHCVVSGMTMESFRVSATSFSLYEKRIDKQKKTHTGQHGLTATFAFGITPLFIFLGRLYALSLRG